MRFISRDSVRVLAASSRFARVPLELFLKVELSGSRLRQHAQRDLKFLIATLAYRNRRSGPQPFHHPETETFLHERKFRTQCRTQCNSVASPFGQHVRTTCSDTKSRTAGRVPYAAPSSQPRLCILQTVEEASDYVAISPITLLCPRCHAQPGAVCEVLADEALEIVHVERIKLALATDAAAKDRIARARIPSKPSE